MDNADQGLNSSPSQVGAIMKANGRISAKRKYTRIPSMEAAISEQASARSSLMTARRSNDPEAIAQAQHQVAAAAERLSQANTEQFERITEVRVTTVLRAIEELIRAAGQRRYRITQSHHDAIIVAIDQAREELQLALTAAVVRSRQPIARRMVVFSAVAIARQH